MNGDYNLGELLKTDIPKSFFYDISAKFTEGHWIITATYEGKFVNLVADYSPCGTKLYIPQAWFGLEFTIHNICHVSADFNMDDLMKNST